jgi:hypothetical protein
VAPTSMIAGNPTMHAWLLRLLRDEMPAATR